MAIAKEFSKVIRDAYRLGVLLVRLGLVVARFDGAMARLSQVQEGLKAVAA